MLGRRDWGRGVVYEAVGALISTAFAALDLRRTTLVCQDWGGLIGLRVLSQMPERFDHLVAMNTALPDGALGATASWILREVNQGHSLGLTTTDAASRRFCRKASRAGASGFGGSASPAFCPPQ